MGPILAGRLAEIAGTSRATFDLGVAMLLGCIALVWCFERLAARHKMEQAAIA